MCVEFFSKRLQTVWGTLFSSEQMSSAVVKIILVNLQKINKCLQIPKQTKSKNIRGRMRMMGTDVAV